MTTVTPTTVMIDGNTAAGQVAYATNEVIAIYPITPSSPMGELSDHLASSEQPNIYGSVPRVQEMQSEGGAAGAIHGALTTGSLSTTFTASQGLLLMIPNMYKIAGELTPTVFHVTARAIAAQALSIFGDHSDVMAVRQTGWAMLAAGSVQEVADLAAISQASTLASRLPVVHFFDGFRTSHEIASVTPPSRETLRALIDGDLVLAHRRRGLHPDHPVLRGSAQNPDVYFQGREAGNPFYDTGPDLIQATMDRYAELTGRSYHLFDYIGDPDAEAVVVMMGSGAETMHETVEALNHAGAAYGLVKVRCFRPFNGQALLEAIPATCQRIAVLDRTKEPGSAGEPLFQDVQSAWYQALSNGDIDASSLPIIIGGRYGLGSKEFTPGMARAVFAHLMGERPTSNFVVGIDDDVGRRSLSFTPFDTELPGTNRALFFGLGADGTVGANKNTIKIIGEATGLHCQGYFVYDSKKSGSMTVSHLRFSPAPIRSAYLIDQAEFLACHSFPLLFQFDMLSQLAEGGTVLLNCPYAADRVWEELPEPVQHHLISKRARCYVIDAYGLARELGLGGRINIIMQTAYFHLASVIAPEQAQSMIEAAVTKTYAAKGERVVAMNITASRRALDSLAEVTLPSTVSARGGMKTLELSQCSDFVQSVTAELIMGRGDQLAVSKMPVDGTFPTGTAAIEKRAVAHSVPIWDPDLCIQCNQCAFVCPHASIRAKVFDTDELNGAPEGFISTEAKGKGLSGQRFTIQNSPLDCTGCGACVHICPGKPRGKDVDPDDQRRALTMTPLAEVRERESAAWDHFLQIPDPTRPQLDPFTLKGSQLRQPLFEFSGACGGCGETPYIKLMSQLYGDRAVIANATGCSSIYSGNLPTTPYTTRADGRGPAWSNSLFEDNAEFGLGMRMSLDQQTTTALHLLHEIAEPVFPNLVAEITQSQLDSHAAIEDQRDRIDVLKRKLAHLDDRRADSLHSVLDHLVPKQVWILGGDGWAYDIGYGGLDHVLASGANVNVLVMDTGVYSNTGGQASKATPRGAVAKFAANGREAARKDLGMLAMASGNVYVAQVAYGANMNQTVKAFREAAEYQGPSLIIAYSQCVAHGINMGLGTDIQRQAVQSGFWPLYRFNPDSPNGSALRLDSKAPNGSLGDFFAAQNRFRSLTRAQPERAAKLLTEAQSDIDRTWARLAAAAGT